MKYFLILFFQSVILQVLAQNNSQSVIYFTKTDSAHFQILRLPNEKKAKYIEFFDDKKQKQQKLPEEIWGFRENNGDLYLSKKILVDNNVLSRFCKVVTLGRASLFTTYIIDNDDRSYFKIANLVRFIQVEQNSPVMIKEGLETNILTYLFKDCEKMSQEYIEKSNPQDLKKLSMLTYEFNECIAPNIEKNVRHTSRANIKLIPGLFVGFEFADLRTNDDGFDFSPSHNFLVGFNCEVLFGDRLALVTGLDYSKSEHHRERYYPLYPDFIEYEDFYISRLKFGVGLKYYLNVKRWRPYLSLSPIASLSPEIKQERIVLSEDGDELPIKNYDINYFMLGFNSNFGIRYEELKLKPFLELRYSYDKVIPAGAKAKDYKITAIQIILGISF